MINEGNCFNSYFYLDSWKYLILSIDEYVQSQEIELPTKWLADEFQVLKVCTYRKEVKYEPISPKGKLFDDKKDALLYHAKLKISY